MTPWRPATRVAFRFCFVYFGLYCLATQVYGGLFIVPGFSLPGLGTLWPMRQITTWYATRVFGVTTPLVYTGTSGDTAFYWVQTAWTLVFAVLATAVWSELDRRRTGYATLHKWFRLFIRFGLAAQMFYYGMAKIIPTQFQAPSLVTLVEPVGNLSLADLLWTFIGASTPYQVFTGVAELIGGLLLLVPQTTLLGAVITMADMLQVFLLNMTYDFGLKQISFHYILMCALLLAPDAPRLLNMFVLGRAADTPHEAPLFRTVRANRVALVAQIVFGLYLVGAHTRISWSYWTAEGGGGSPRSALYGIWDIEELAIDGESRPPHLNDYDRRWRRVIFDQPSSIVFQRTDDSFAHYRAAINVEARTVDVTRTGSAIWKARFSFERPQDDRLILEGEMDGYRIRLRGTLVPLDTFRLRNSRFRWIRPSDPFAG